MQIPLGEWVKDCLRHSEFLGGKLLYKLIWRGILSFFFFLIIAGLQNTWKKSRIMQGRKWNSLLASVREAKNVPLFPASFQSHKTLISRSENKISFLLFFTLCIWRVPKGACDGLIIVSLCWARPGLRCHVEFSVTPAQWSGDLNSAPTF